jgi:hypothetical protein
MRLPEAGVARPAWPVGSGGGHPPSAQALDLQIPTVACKSSATKQIDPVNLRSVPPITAQLLFLASVCFVLLTQRNGSNLWEAKMDTCVIQSMPWVEHFSVWIRAWTNQPASWANAVQAMASVIGFFVLFVQVRHLRNNIRGATHDRLYAHYNDVCKELMKKPELYPYFYGELPYPPDINNAACKIKTLDAPDTNKTVSNEVKILSEMICGVIEHAKVQEKNLPLDSWMNCWLLYSLDRIDRSPSVHKFFKENSNWYTPSVKKVLR